MAGEKEVKQINTALKRLGYTFDSLSTVTKKELVKIQIAVNELEGEHEFHKSGLKSTVINITNVSKRSGISRKTFYNNEILSKVITKYAEDFEDDPVPNETLLNEYKERLNAKEKQIEKLLSTTVIDAENIRCENDRLMAKIESLTDQLESLRDQFDQLFSEKKDIEEKYYALKAKTEADYTVN